MTDYRMKDSDLDGYPLSEENLRGIEEYSVRCLRESKLPLPINSRFALSMVREIRAHREFVKAVHQGLKNLKMIELRSRNRAACPRCGGDGRIRCEDPECTICANDFYCPNSTPCGCDSP